MVGFKKLQRWTDAEIEFLAQNWSKMTDTELAKKLNRTQNGVKHKRFQLCLRKGRMWTKEEINFLKQNYGIMPILKIAQLLHRSYASIQHKIQRLCLKRELSLQLDPVEIDSQQIEPDFWAWFAGFWEGEGYIIRQNVVTTHRLNNKLYSYPTTAYAFGVVQKDRQALECIQERLGGYIYKKSNSECYEWKIYRKEKIELITRRMLPHLRFRREHLLEKLKP